MTNPTSAPQSPKPNRRLGWLLLLLVVGVGGYFLWQSLREKSVPVEVLQLNAAGIGVMEKFDYLKAVPIFARVHEMAPEWIPGTINLAIAQLNLNTPETTEIAANLCREVLAKEPNNPHANYIIGIIQYYRFQGRPELPEQAFRYFEAVSKVDPMDAYSWFYMGETHPNGPLSVEALELHEKALKLDPYFNMARYRIAFHILNSDDPVKRKNLIDEHSRLRDAFWEVESRIRYYDMGPYARVIGLDAKSAGNPEVGPLPTFEKWDQLQMELAADCHWAKTADLDPFVLWTRKKFGAVIALLDFDQDGLIDILMLGAVVEDGKVRNLLLRNLGGGKFVDVTKAAGLADPHHSLGCAIGDFDNDGFPDIVITGNGSQKLFRNNGAGKFEDVSAKAGLDKVPGICLTAAWIDLDQDGDLDLLLACYSTESGAWRPDLPPGGLLAFVNTGLAPLVDKGQAPKPLSCEFQRMKDTPELQVTGKMLGITLVDFDADKDVDLLLHTEGKTIAVRNDRLLRFTQLPALPAASTTATCGLVLDINRDERSDLLLLEPRITRLQLSHDGYLEENPAKWYTEGDTSASPLLQARAFDLDLDGWTDAIGLANDRKMVFLQNDGNKRLIEKRNTFGTDLPADLMAFAVLDIDGDCAPDLLVWSESLGLQARRNRGNGNKAVRVELRGTRARTDPETARSNESGIGAQVVIHAGRIWTSAEFTTLTAGLGQSLVPLEFGLGKQDHADVVRIRWPDLIPQAEVKIPACEKQLIREINRKPDSCPTLFVWDGERYVFVSDVLGASSMGEMSADGNNRPARPEESFKIPPGLLKAQNGKFKMKISEPMNEVMYLDHMQLLAIDRPKEEFVYPDERFPSTDVPTQNLLVFRERIAAQKALDHKDRDCTQTLRDWDGKSVQDFAIRRWPGFAEDHFVELDFGDSLSRFSKTDRLFLCLAGWTEYAYPESIYAASQAKIEMQMPTLERQDTDGKWNPVCEVSLPAGLPRMMTKEVTGLLTGPTCKFRIRTNLQVFWDQIFIAPLVEIETKPTVLEVAHADLQFRGFVKEITPVKNGPIEYDDSQLEPVAVTKWKGLITKTGDVTELLQARDDQFVICGPGDEVTLTFDSTKLPPLKEGYERSYVLKSAGYCKDNSPFTAFGGQIGPLPFQKMESYPPKQPNPDPAQAAYDLKWNRRFTGMGR